MTILLFSDIHSDQRALDSILATPADLYFAAGDLVNWAKGLEAVGEKLRPLAGKLCVIPGNHESEGDINAFCDRYGFESLHGRVKSLPGGYTLAALGYSNPTPFNTPGEYSEAELERRLQPFSGTAKLILVCHVPPFGTPLDESAPGRHFGSTAVARFVEAEQPDYFFCGHIHEAAGRELRIGKTHARNLGKKGHRLNLPAD